MTGDISEQSRSLARFIDRLPKNEIYIIRLEAAESSPWLVTITKEEEVRRWELKRKNQSSPS